MIPDVDIPKKVFICVQFHFSFHYFISFYFLLNLSLFFFHNCLKNLSCKTVIRLIMRERRHGGTRRISQKC